MKDKDRQERILTSYFRELTTRGRPIGTVKSHLGVYFRYVNDVDLDFLRVRIRDAQDFQTYLSSLLDEDGRVHYAKQTVMGMVSSITSFYDYLCTLKLVPANAFHEVMRMRKDKTLSRNILTEEEMGALLAGLRDFNRGRDLPERRNRYRAHVVSELMYSTGARVNEIAKITPADIDFSRNTVRLRDSKTGTQRDGILNEYASKILRIYVEDMREYVLSGEYVNRNSENLFGRKRHLVDWVNEVVSRESVALGYGRFTSHSFRHSVGFHLLRGGCDIRYIQEILGHKELSSTQIYTRVDKEDLKGVIDTFHPRRFRE